MRRGFLTWALAVQMLAAAGAPESPAETYVAGQLGITVPGRLSHVNWISPLDRGPDFDLKTAFLYGGKLGHYFMEAPWLGVETEVFRTNPVITQRPPEPGASFSMTTWAMTLIVRYPGERWQPYVGIGPGIFFGRVRSTSPVSRFVEAQSTSIGLNSQVGGRYFLTRHLTVFAEWKFNHSRVSFDAIPNATYNAHHVVAGMGYHF